MSSNIPKSSPEHRLSEAIAEIRQEKPPSKAPPRKVFSSFTSLKESLQELVTRRKVPKGAIAQTSVESSTSKGISGASYQRFKKKVKRDRAEKQNQPIRTSDLGEHLMFHDLSPEIYPYSESETILQAAMDKLALTAKLSATEQGFVYLDLPNGYIADLLPLFPSSCKAPPFFSQQFQIGAHVPIFFPKDYLGEIPEIGNSYTFSLKGCFYQPSRHWEEITEIYFLSFDAPSLEALRKKYGLSKSLGPHTFSAVIAIKPGEPVASCEMLRINPAIHPA